MNKQIDIADACAPPARPDRDANCEREIAVRLDSAGFIIEASQNAAMLGVELEGQLLMPHIADFAIAQYRPRVSRYFVEVIAGECGDAGIEFPVSTQECEPVGAFGGPPASSSVSSSVDAVKDWYRLTLTCLEHETGREGGGEGGGEIGAIGTLEAIERAEAKPRNTPMSANCDPFTDLSDRRSFVSGLVTSLAMSETVSIALFAIDGMRSIYMQYGQGTADDIRWGFARFLETMVEPHHTLAQIDDERFGVILPGARSRDARAWANGALQIFEALAVPSTGSKPQLSASAGIARAELSAEWTIRQAELGLVMARAAGGMQTAICRPHSSLSNGRGVKRAMDEVVERAVRRV